MWCLLVSAIFVYFLPVTAWIIHRKKSGAEFLPLLAGAGGFFAASILRGILRAIILTEGLKSSPSVYYFLMALISGTAEETVRYIIFRYLIPYKNDLKDAVSCGIGHGGADSIIVCGIKGAWGGLFIIKASYTLFGTDIFLREGWSVGELEDVLSDILSIGKLGCMRGAFDSISALVFSAALSVLVFTAVHIYPEHKKRLMAAAIALHTANDLTAVLEFGGTVSYGAYGIIEALLAAAIGYAVYRIYVYYREIC